MKFSPKYALKDPWSMKEIDELKKGLVEINSGIDFAAKLKFRKNYSTYKKYVLFHCTLYIA